jgi:alpha-beta hydrolase superfamily lysophospholipase
MNEAEGTLTLQSGAGAGAALRSKHWLIADPKAVVLISHGYAEHLGRYEHVAAALNTAGYSVYALDHWGHGKSDGAPGFVPAFSVFLDGLDTLLAESKAAYPDKKKFLIGHSMGGLVAANYLPARQEEFAGAVLSGSSVKAVDEPPAAVLFVGRVLSKLAPKAGLISLDASLVSRDANVVETYIADPLVYKGKISARLGAEMIDAMKRAVNEAPRLRLPILFLHGGADGLTSPEGSKILSERVSSSDSTLKIYDGFYHEIFNDPGKEEVIADMIRWIDAHA